MFIFNKQIFPILCVCFLYDKLYSSHAENRSVETFFLHIQIYIMIPRQISQITVCKRMRLSQWTTGLKMELITQFLASYCSKFLESEAQRKNK